MFEDNGNGTREPVLLSKDMRPTLLTVVHTEEEFDWSCDFDTSATTVSHIRHINRVQDIFDHFAVTPTYVVDYPIAAQDESIGTLLPFVNEGRAFIGTHLHPWVSPPVDEAISVFNSYPGNLPAALEEEKLRRLTQCIEQCFGRRPRVYLAGRYGFGANTGTLLRRLGYEVDLSPVATFDYSRDGGPDYRTYPVDPFWEGADRRLLRIPHTAGFAGFLCRRGRPQIAWENIPLADHLRLPGIFARLRAAEHLRLTPEGFSLAAMQRPTRTLLDGGTRVFLLSFHSPSVVPGWTPYVRSDEDLAAFLQRLTGYFDFFAHALEGVFATPEAVKAACTSPSTSKANSRAS